MICQFPFNVELLFRENQFSVILDNMWPKANVKVELLDCATNHSRYKKATKIKSRIEFDNIVQGNRYKLQAYFEDTLRRLKCKKYVKYFTFNGQKKLRVIATGTGRCGTTSLARYLNNALFIDGEVAIARHETLYEIFLTHIINKETEKINDLVFSFPHNIEIAPYFSLYPESLIADRVVMMIRDGRKVVSSGIARGWFTRDTIWDKVKPQYSGSQFEKACKLWKNCNEQVIERADIIVRLEDITISLEEQKRLADAIGVCFDKNNTFPHENVSTNLVKLKWHKHEHAIFEKHCGKIMDIYYPGWKNDNLISFAD
ncbi:MAG: hypothetical protein GY874_15890 [Desulfobacteraceae bacterium]|nr:hypothetical protein [Desulfobacteraceae bacterium]